MKKLPRPSKKSLYLLGLLVITLMGFTIMPTYAKFAKGYTTTSDVSELVLDFSIGITNIEEYEEIVVPSGSYELFNVEVSNADANTLYYGVWYRMVNPTTKTSDITIARLEGTETLTSGELLADASTTTSIIIINNSNEDITVNIGVTSSNTSTSDIEYLGGKRLITGMAEKPLVNAPNLDKGNLLPVYYDDTVQASDGTYGVWKKADSTNKNNSWYDYENKKWANAVIISEDATTDYSSAEVDVGTTITDSDIIAFYVWIPRFKYRVWNINRQGHDVDDYSTYEEDYYAYPAYTKGIEIEFETGTASTGNVECTYDVTTAESETNLSDKCYYNGSTIPIATTDLNTYYVDENEAWYTHPAFTFGEGTNKEKTGFWIGKFETSTTTTSTCYTTPNSINCNNIDQEPRILPDVSSLRNQNVSNQFTTAKKFQNYLSSDMDAHMLTNLEWGAVAYLTHSLYGLCNESSCQGVYHNNSEGYYTGRSSGAIADGTSSTYGTYNYKGYTLSDNTPTGDKIISLVASTTGNITGVYDMSGGAFEYVMGNEVNLSNGFYPMSAVSGGVTNPWNGNSTLDVKYYNSYSYGYYNSSTIAFNRSRLGDATAEVLGGTLEEYNAWKPGTNGGITGSRSYFVYSSYSWFYRGGSFSNDYSSIFTFYSYYGSGNGGSSFHSSLS